MDSRKDNTNIEDPQLWISYKNPRSSTRNKQTCMKRLQAVVQEEKEISQATGYSYILCMLKRKTGDMRVI